MSLTADRTSAEGGNITSTATLGAAAHGRRWWTITGSVITIASGAASGTVRAWPRGTTCIWTAAR
ncbi:MAG: hypothetical protein IPN05_19800 [Sulfuritalea sp.]|nr:hypothetical protein [Sulfuritalea sp.]